MKYVYEPRHEKYVFGFPTRSDINQTLQQQKLVGGGGGGGGGGGRHVLNFENWLTSMRRKGAYRRLCSRISLNYGLF